MKNRPSFQQIKLIAVLILAALLTFGCRIGNPAKPVATILAPASGANFTLGNEVLVQSSSLSQDGIDRVELWVNGQLVAAEAGNAKQSVTALHRWKPMSAGAYLLEVRAVDVVNQPSDPVGVTVTIDPQSERLTVVESTFTPTAARAVEDTPTSTPTPTATSTPQPGIPMITSRLDLNVRSGPSTRFDILGALRNGTTAEILGINPERTWWLIAFAGAPGGTGWVSADAQYGTAINTEAVPVVQSPATPTGTPSLTPTPTATATFTPIPTSTNTPSLIHPVIHYFRADKRDITEGDSVLLEWDLSGADKAYLYPGGETGIAAPGSLMVTPVTTTTYKLVALNSNSQVEASLTINVAPKLNPPTIVYNFIDNASTANWQNGSGVELPWNGSPADVRGFVILHNNITLEDNSRPSRALQTHPEWILNGTIQGNFDANFTIKSGDRFLAQVGFLKGAGVSNGVTFELCYFTFIEGTCFDPLQKTVTGQLAPFEIDLSPLNGYNSGWFQLRVQANGSAEEDWAVWINPRIERP